MNAIRKQHEEKARYLLDQCKAHGFEMWTVADEEGSVRMFQTGQEEQAVKELTACDMTSLTVSTRGYTEAEVETIAFYLLWLNEEFIMDHSDKEKASTIADNVAEHFDF